jgi:hypothetical protein
MARTSRVVFPSLEVSVHADFEEAKKAFKSLAPRGVNRAAENALNVIGRTVRRESINEIALRRRGHKREIGRTIYIRRARAGSASVVVGMAGAPVSLKHYGARATKTRGVTVNITGRRKSIDVPGAFMSSAQARPDYTESQNNRRTLGGHVFERRGKARGQLRKLMGPSLASAFYHKVVVAKQREVIARDWARVFSEKLDDQLEKARFKR